MTRTNVVVIWEISLPLNIGVNLKLLQKIKVLTKQTNKQQQNRKEDKYKKNHFKQIQSKPPQKRRNELKEKRDLKNNKIENKHIVVDKI